MACSAAHALVPSGQTLPELLFFESLDCKQLCNQHQASSLSACLGAGALLDGAELVPGGAARVRAAQWHGIRIARVVLVELLHTSPSSLVRRKALDLKPISVLLPSNVVTSA